MKKTTFLFLIAFFLLCASTAQAQLDISYQNTEPKMPTWQTYEFMRYGKVASSLYTGTVNYSIPFYTYKDNDFEIPISFDYASNGFRTNSQTGPLGHDWLLNVGGIITREIKGIPDDVSASVITPNGTGINPRGFYYVYMNDISQSSVHPPQIFLDSSYNLVFYNEIYSGGNYYHYDIEPDIYHFNFMGYSGSFHFWYNGKIEVFNTTGSSAGIKVKPDDNEMGAFQIITPNGYTYIFYSNNGEYIPKLNNGIETKTTISWKLGEIIAPNGRKASFCYGIPRNSATGNNYRYIPRTNYYQTNWPPYADNSTSSYLGLDIDNVISYPLDSIKVSGNTTIRFSHIVSNTEKYIYNGKIEKAAIYTALIDKIEVFHENTMVKRCNINYTYSKADPWATTGNIIPFLGSVKISGEGSYSFNYDGLADKTFPYLGSFSFDHWGYYNGMNDNLRPVDMTESLSYDSQHNEILNTSLKNPNATYAMRGMLKRISYPTGGYSELEYEPHKYSAKIVRNSQNSFVPSISYLTNDEITGGLRIKKIVNYSSDGIKTDSLSYIYAGSNNLSSGILINVPRYGVEYTASDGYNNRKSVKFYSSSNNIYNYDKTHIEYSRVTERKSDNSTTDYYFTTSLTSPDGFSAGGNLGSNSNDVPTFVQYDQDAPGRYYATFFHVGGFSQEITNILTPTTSFQSKRGHLWRKEIRGANGILLRNEITNYEFPSISQIVTPKIVGEVWKNISSEEIDHRIANTSVSNYENNVQIDSRTDFSYNMHGQTINTKTTTSAGDSLITKYLYVTDITPTPTSGIYKNMLDNNVTNYPMQETVYLKKNNVLKQISAKRYTYVNPDINNGKLIRPSTVEVWNQGETWTTTIRYNAYDNMGNLLEMEDKNGRHTAFLWSYGGQYLIAKIENATYAVVNTFLSSNGLISAAALSAMSDPGDDIINGLKNLKSQLPNASIFVYRHKSLVGIREAAAPNKITSYYGYDAWGRLINIEDNEHKKTNLYKYNISTIEKLTVDLPVSSSYYIGAYSFTVTTHGGSGEYEYLWTLKNASGSVMYTSTTSVPTVSITFSKLGTMSLSCKVIDTVTQEKIDCVKTFVVTPVPIEFTNVHSFTDSSGHYITEGFIKCSKEIDVDFLFRCETHSSINIKVRGVLSIETASSLGNLTFLFTTYGEQSFTRRLPIGNTRVRIDIEHFSPEAYSSFCITSAGDCLVGRNSCLTIY
nr:hypothetical protein [uncultured Bacteroides sp.]